MMKFKWIAILVVLVPLMSAGCARLSEIDVEPCATIAQQLTTCGASDTTEFFDVCDDSAAESFIGSDCPQLLSALENQELQLIQPKSRRGRMPFLCRLGFLAYCPAVECAADDFIDEPSDGDDCIEWTRFSGCQACEYYRCRERQSHCGSDGYLVGYVGKYCDRFSTVTEKRISPAGAQWMSDVRACLIGTLDQWTDSTDSCETIEQVGIESHSGCYLQAGFCSLPFTDWFAIVHTIDAFDIPMRQIFSTGHGCLRQWFGFGHR